MRIYYSMVVWEEIDQYEIEKLQNRVQEFGKRLNGFGILSFNMQAQPPAGTTQPQTQAQQAEPEMTPEEQAQLEEDERILQEEEARLAKQGQGQAQIQQQPGEILDE